MGGTLFAPKNSLQGLRQLAVMLFFVLCSALEIPPWGLGDASGGQPDALLALPKRAGSFEKLSLKFWMHSLTTTPQWRIVYRLILCFPKDEL